MRSAVAADEWHARLFVKPEIWSTPKGEFLDHIDHELAKIRQDLLARKPYLDGSSLRAAWSHRQRLREFAEAQELAASGNLREW